MLDDLKRIEICLRCPVAKQLISEYKIYYTTMQRFGLGEATAKAYRRERKEKIFVKKELPEQVVQSVDRISSILNIKGTIEERINYLNQLRNLNNKYSSISNGINGIDKNIDTYKTIQVKLCDCALMLHIVCANIKPLFEMNDNNLDKVTDSGESIILLMGQYLNECGIKCNLSKIKKTQNYDNVREIFEIKKSNYNIYSEIFYKYCNTENQFFKFEYINPLLIKYVSNKNIPCDKLKNCEHQLFLENIEKYHPTKFITNRINNLRGDYLEIAEKFLLDVPKKLTLTLSHLKILQNLSYKEIGVLLWNKKEITSRPIQSYCEDEHRKVPDEEINRLAKILLVSEDVLRRGYGKIYSDWEEILENPATSDKINKIIDKETHPIELTSDTDKILLLLNQSDEDFYKMIEPYEEDINLYLRKFTEEELKNEYIVIEDIDDDLKYYYDYETMYKTALHPEEIDVLISVLEELQAQENN